VVHKNTLRPPSVNPSYLVGPTLRLIDSVLPLPNFNEQNSVDIGNIVVIAQISKMQSNPDSSSLSGVIRSAMMPALTLPGPMNPHGSPTT